MARIWIRPACRLRVKDIPHTNNRISRCTSNSERRRPRVPLTRSIRNGNTVKSLRVDHDGGNGRDASRQKFPGSPEKIPNGLPKDRTGNHCFTYRSFQLQTRHVVTYAYEHVWLVFFKHYNRIAYNSSQHMDTHENNNSYLKIHESFNEFETL